MSLGSAIARRVGAAGLSRKLSTVSFRGDESLGRQWLVSPGGGSRVRILRSAQYSPFVNLAIEEAIFKEHVGFAADRDMRGARTLLLWCNDPSVIIGRNQSAHRECRLQAMEEQGVNLVRRRSGGGAVYHDRGNAIFSFVSPEAGARATNNATLVAALARLGVAASASGRNDIEVMDPASSGDPASLRKKVSGAAFRFEHDTLLHHGTMLLHVDMDALSRLLNPDRLKLESKAIKSVAGRVVNLRDMVPNIDRSVWEDALVRSFLEQHGFGAEALQEDALVSVRGIIQTVDHVRAVKEHAIGEYSSSPTCSALFRRIQSCAALLFSLRPRRGERERCMASRVRAELQPATRAPFPLGRR